MEGGTNDATIESHQLKGRVVLFKNVEVLPRTVNEVKRVKKTSVHASHIDLAIEVRAVMCNE